MPWWIRSLGRGFVGCSQIRLDVLHQSEEVISSQLTVAQNLREQTRADRLARVNGHYGCPTIKIRRMTVGGQN